MSSVKVAVRVRPFNKREIKKNTKCIVSINNNSISIEKQIPSTQIYKPVDDVIKKSFCFDHCFWSFDKEDKSFASQTKVYNDIGKGLLDHAFMGYNTCIFAYGQTGAGKSYTMMGNNEDKGVIPLACEDMFDRIKANEDKNLTYIVEISYIEIYCERVRDLLNPSNKENLRVREHPVLGPYVEDLSKLVVTSHEEILKVMDEGNKSRTVASTKMNEVSSRSHAVFTIKLTQKYINKKTNVTTQKESRISFVDLAGSERVNSTKNTGVRLKEGVNINKSLTTLGKVISALAEQSAKNSSAQNSNANSLPSSPTSIKSPRVKAVRTTEMHIPYRDSVLTWLLKDSLGGNSKTIVIAAISPADINYDESLSTLRFAERAKHIINTAVINESNNAKLVDELKREVESLKKELAKLKQQESHHSNSQDVSELQDLLSAKEKLVKELNKSWEEKLKETENIHKQRVSALEDLGITLDKKNDIVGLRSPQKIPHLVNLNEDPLMSECLLYQIRPGITRVGKYQLSQNADILLTGVNVKDNHCYFENQNGTVTLYPNLENNAITLVNGRKIYKPKILKSGYRIIIGECHVFRFINPEEARKERKLMEKHNTNSTDVDDTVSDFSTPSSCEKDWYYAQKERLSKEGFSALSSADSIADIQINDEITSTTSSSISNKQARPDINKYEKRNAHINNVLNNIISTYSYKEPSAMPLSTSVKSKRSFGSLNLTRISDTASIKSVDPKTIQDSMGNTDPAYNIFSIRKSNSLSYGSRQKPFSVRKHEFQKLNISTSNLANIDKGVKASPKFLYESPSQKKSLFFRNDRAYLSHFGLKGVEHDPHELMKKVFDFWKTKKFVKLSESISNNLSNIKQANIISKELNMNVVYQFIITNDIYPLPKSFWEISILNDISMSEIKINEEFEDVLKIEKENDAYIHSFYKNSEHFSKEYPYRLIVKVLDGQNNKVYYWSLNEFLNRLNQMKVIYESNILNNRIVYDPYNNMIDPFKDQCKTSFMLVGYSKCILSGLLYSKYNINYTFRLPIIEWQTGKRKGYLTVKFLSIYDPSEDEYVATENELLDKSTDIDDQVVKDSEKIEETNEEENKKVQNSKSLSNKNKIKVGTELYFDIIVEKIEGLSEDEFTQIHCQFNTSDFNKKLTINGKKKKKVIEVDETSEKDNKSLYSTNIKSGFKDNDIVFNYSQTVHLHVTKNILRNLKYGYLKFEIFGSKPDGVISSLINDLYTKDNNEIKEFGQDQKILDTPAPQIQNKILQKEEEVINGNNTIDNKEDENENSTNNDSTIVDNVHASQSTSDDDPATLNDSLEMHSQSQANLSKNDDSIISIGTLKRLKNRLSFMALSNKRSSSILEAYDSDSDIPQISRRSTILKKASKTLRRFSSKPEFMQGTYPPTPERKSSISSIVPLESISVYHHTMNVSIKICELSADGTYEPVDVQYLSLDDLGAFLIHQGLQRRIEVEISHTSGDSLPIKYIKGFTLSHIRKTNIKSKNSHDSTYVNGDSKSLTLMPVTDEKKEMFGSGKHSVTSTYSWDSSLHESLLLNRETEKDSKVLVRVEFEIGFEGQHSPSGITVTFNDHRSESDKLNNPFSNLRVNQSCKISMDIALIIQNRQESSSIFSFFYKSNLIKKQYLETFNVVLNKDENGQKNCLFPIPKKETYVRGEENLDHLKFSSAEDLIIQSVKTMKKRRTNHLAEFSRQYLYLKECQRKAEENKEEGEETKETKEKEKEKEKEEEEDQYFSNYRLPTPTLKSPIRNSDKIFSVVFLWKNYTLFMKRDIKRCFYLDNKEEKRTTTGENLLYFTPTISKIKYSSKIERKGHLFYPDPESEMNEDSWVRSYVVIKKPYLYIYEHKNMVDLVDVINLLDAKVSYNPDLVNTMNKENVFEVYTQYHNIFLQASNKKDMIQWITTIDPLGLGVALSNIHQQK